jgi:hypothetical protein
VRKVIIVPFVYAQYLQITLQGWANLCATLAMASMPVCHPH